MSRSLLDSTTSIDELRFQSKLSSLRLPQRLVLALVLASEWIPISSRFHFHRGGGILFQIGFVSVALFLGIGFVRFKESFQRISLEVQREQIGWPCFAGHLPAFLAFVGLSLLSEQSLVGFLGSVVAALWFASGSLAILLVACAFVPPRLIVTSANHWLVVGIFLGRGIDRSEVVTYCALWGGAVWNPALDLSWKPAVNLTFSLVQVLLTIVLPNVVADRSTMTIGTRGFRVEILPWCAGFEGTALILVFGIAWLTFFRREYRFPQALLLIPAGMTVMWISNAFRITALILIGVAGAPHVAIGGFHSQAGWIAFSSVALAFIVLSQRLPWVVKEAPRSTSESATSNPTAEYLMPLVAILAAGMISTAASGEFEWLYPLRFFAAIVAIWYFRASYWKMDWRFSWLSVAAGILVFGIWIGMNRLVGSAVDRGTAADLASIPLSARLAWLTFRTAAAIIAVPIAEELAFRGFLIRRLILSDFEVLPTSQYTLMSVVVSSTAFGLLHGQQWIAGVLAGLIFAVAWLRRGRIGDAVIAHATANALLAVWVLQGGRWYLW